MHRLTNFTDSKQQVCYWDAKLPAAHTDCICWVIMNLCVCMCVCVCVFVCFCIFNTRIYICAGSECVCHSTIEWCWWLHWPALCSQPTSPSRLSSHVTGADQTIHRSQWTLLRISEGTAVLTVRQMQRWPGERIGRGKLLLCCVCQEARESLGRPRGRRGAGHIVSPRAQLVCAVLLSLKCGTETSLCTL